MGRAARWLRGLLAGRRGGADDKPAKEKRKWGFVKSLREREVPTPAPATATATAGVLDERRGSYREVARRPPAVVVDQEEQSKRAIAVAAATAAVAEAAVAAAQAAAAVVRLTSSGRSVVGGFGGAKWAAVKIQAAFRGYLARRALRALKGLVKLQALVRGNIVRKQAAETLRCMHALVRVQARVRACRAIHSERSNCNNKGSRHHPGPPTPEKHEATIRANAPKSSTLKRNSSKPPISTDTSNSNRAHTSGWNWLDRWMEERYCDSREASRATMDDEKNAKILEIDTWKPQLNTKGRSRNHHQHSSCSTLTSDHNSRSFPTLPDSPSMDSTAAQQSNPSTSSVDMVGDLVESPQFYSASSRPGSSRRGPFTPAKSEFSRSLFSGYSDYPNYMANTESSKAKVRSQSAPKQRPEFEKSGSFKRLSAHGFCREPSVVATAQRSSFANKGYPGSGRLDRMGMPIRYQ